MVDCTGVCRFLGVRRAKSAKDAGRSSVLTRSRGDICIGWRRTPSPSDRTSNPRKVRAGAVRPDEDEAPAFGDREARRCRGRESHRGPWPAQALWLFSRHGPRLVREAQDPQDHLDSQEHAAPSQPVPQSIDLPTIHLEVGFDPTPCRPIRLGNIPRTSILCVCHQLVATEGKHELARQQHPSCAREAQRKRTGRQNGPCVERAAGRSGTQK